MEVNASTLMLFVCLTYFTHDSSQFICMCHFQQSLHWRWERIYGVDGILYLEPIGFYYFFRILFIQSFFPEQR